MKITYPFIVVFRNDYDDVFELWVKADYGTPAHAITDNFADVIARTYDRAATSDINLSDYTVKEIRVGGSIVAEFARYLVCIGHALLVL